LPPAFGNGSKFIRSRNISEGATISEELRGGGKCASIADGATTSDSARTKPFSSAIPRQRRRHG